MTLEAWMQQKQLMASNDFIVFQSQPGGLLFTKFGSNHTALLDLAFPVC